MTAASGGNKKLAIVGAGSAGLICLYYALRRLSGWEIACFERSAVISGAWGDPYAGFVSTSTKYTTQFSCHRRFEATADRRREGERLEFFRDDEYGVYLREFVRAKGLAPFLRLQHEVRQVEHRGARWRLTLERSAAREAEAVCKEEFDALILCTGLAERPKEIPCGIEQLLALEDADLVRGKKIVIVGGGESAVDIANRLAEASLGNEVLLSLRTGIRVSPRYHPIKGVPSDFLRTRLMLSIHKDIRNAVGQKFVEARIKHQEILEVMSRRKTGRGAEPSSVREKRKYWAAKLTEHAKDGLFNMFHNKADDFLDAVAEGRLRIVGPPLDSTYRTYADFVEGPAMEFDPDILVPKIGFSSNLAALTDGAVRASDFYLGCLHPAQENLFLVGFARPILGNIPSINEIQAQFVLGMLAGCQARPADILEAHRRERESLESTYAQLDIENLYPVEMFPYCDRLARTMGTYPTLSRVGSLRGWLKTWLSPASTLHYLDENYDASFIAQQPIHAPWIVSVLLLLIRILDIGYSRLWRREREAPV